MIKRPWLLYLLLAGITIPFVFQIDFYPFFRFAMFAEPIRSQTQVEQYMLVGCANNKQSIKIELSQYDLFPENVHYIIRNYYYKGEIHAFLKQVHQLPACSKYPTIKVIQGFPLKDSYRVIASHSQPPNH